MRDSKSLLILIFALVLVTISFVLISIWGYHFYFQPKDDKPVSIEKTPLIIKKTATRDSLQALLDSTIQQLGVRQNNSVYDSTDTADKNLELKLLEYNKLKEEIAEILKNKTSSKDTSVANEKIDELQKSIDELRDKNNEVAKENAKLNKMLKQFIVENKQNVHSANNNDNTKNTGSLTLLVSHLRFVAVNDDNERETNLASQTNKLAGSFQINFNSDKSTSSEIYVVIVQPNGKILLNSAWESGTFETTDGRKVYSAILHFDNTKDNHKRLQFSIGSRTFQKGKYAMQIYHNGIMIGRIVRTLD